MMLLAASTGEPALLFAGFFCYGFGFGGTIPIKESLWVSYFGRAHIGAVRGIAQPLSIIGPTIAPVLVGVAYDLRGNYSLAFLGIIAIYLLASLLVGISRARTPIEPKERGEPRSVSLTPNPYPLQYAYGRRRPPAAPAR